MGIFTQILPRGKENAISKQQLMDRLRIGDERELRRLIAEARTRGELICTTSKRGGGYFVPETKQEVQAWYRKTRKTALSTFVALKSARKYLAEMEGQMSLSEILAEGDKETSVEELEKIFLEDPYKGLEELDGDTPRIEKIEAELFRDTESPYTRHEL